MATLDINGTHVNVDDSFLKLSPDEQQNTVDHIAATLSPPAPDPVSTNDVVRSAATGVPILGGLLNKADAATNAVLAPAFNSFFDEKDQLPESTFSERYAHSLRDQEGGDDKFATQHPIIDTGAKLAGGVAGMAPLVGAAPSLWGADAAAGLGTRIGMGAASNALMGGADSGIRGNGVVGGALVGGVLGAAAPAAEAVASPLIGSIMARFNPEGTAQRQVARAISESGRPTADIANDVTQAAAEGQGQFTLADSLGNPGQRMLSTVTRAPGEGRTDAVNFLENRQAGQGRRISNALAEGFNAPETAAQTEARLTAARGTQADTDFGAVRDGAGSVDVMPAINHIDSILGPGADQQLANGGSALPNDSIEGALQGFRNRLARVNPDDFSSVQRIRSDMADAAQNAAQSGFGNRARMIRDVVGHLDTTMENASNGFRQANRNFAAASRDIEAVGAGRDAYNRGRTENTIPAFNALRPEAQQAFRAGYVDPAIAQTQGAAFGRNKALPFTNDAFRDEAAVMAPGNDLMQRRIGREQTMATTRNQALGGSSTSQNLNDDAAMAIDPKVVLNLFHGNWAGAIGSMLHAGTNMVTGNTPAVRAAVGRILLQSGATLNPATLNAMVNRTVGQLQAVQALTRSAAGAAATTANAANHPNRNTPIFVTRK